TDIYEILRKSTEFQTYLIPYIEVSERQDVLGYLNKYKNIVCKANSGSFGLNVYFIKDLEEYIEVKLHKQVFKYTKDEFIEFVDNTFIQTKSKYVIQPYIQSRTNDGNPFDLRVHLMKDRNGKWSIVRIYPRIGARNSIISNLHLGGSTCDLTTFLTKHITIKDRKTFTKSLRTFALKFADFMEKDQEDHFSELGLDIAVDENEKLWLFEVNMNRINIANLTFEAANHAISYGKHVILQKQLSN